MLKEDSERKFELHTFFPNVMELEGQPGFHLLFQKAKQISFNTYLVFLGWHLELDQKCQIFSHSASSQDYQLCVLVFPRLFSVKERHKMSLSDTANIVLVQTTSRNSG